MIKISELQTKDVVNVTDGRKLGQVSDLEINLSCGRVEAIVVPTSNKRFNLFSNEDAYVIPWRHIVKIGSDVILVRLGVDSPDDVFHPEVEQVAYRPRERHKKN